jgi:hypothetical protein
MVEGVSDANLPGGPFGDFVPTRQLAVEQNVRIYRARRQAAPPGEKSESFVVVLCRGEKSGGGTIGPASEEEQTPTLEPDRRLEFLEVVKQQKKAHECGARQVVPVLDFGIAPEGAWYACDYYPRGFLKKWISQRAGVSEEELRHIVSSAAQCLLALKQQCHRSHGSLTGASILIGGKPGAPLREAPLFFTYLKPGDERDASRFELADLRALGLIIYQLVCRQDTPVFHADNFPIPPSEHWRQLGKFGDFWRELCNRLLDPGLVLDKLSLEKLVAELPGEKPVQSNGLWIGVAAGAIALVAGGVYLATRASSSTPPPATQATRATLTSNAPPVVAEAAKAPPVAPPKEIPLVPPARVPVTNVAETTESTNPETIALEGIGDQAVEQGTRATQFPFTLGVSDRAAQSLFVASASSKPDFLPDASLKIEGDGNKRVLVVDPVPEQLGEVILAVSVVGARTNVTRTFWFKVVAPRGAR